jgi:hypothetical protein
MADKDTLLKLIDVLREVQTDAKLVAGLRAKVDLLLIAMAGIYAAFWGYILITILSK